MFYVYTLQETSVVVEETGLLLYSYEEHDAIILCERKYLV